jgi:hypothetical protein
MDGNLSLRKEKKVLKDGVQRQPLLGNGSANTPVIWRLLSNRYVFVATYTHATTEELLEVVLSMRSVPKSYKEDQLTLRDILRI